MPQMQADEASTEQNAQTNEQNGSSNRSGLPRVLFNASKRESHQPNGGFKKWYRKLRAHAQVNMYVPFSWHIVNFFSTSQKAICSHYWEVQK